MIAKLQDKFDREKVKYLEMTDKNVDRSRELIKKIPNHLKIRDVVYVYVVFKHCNSVSDVLKEF